MVYMFFIVYQGSWKVNRDTNNVRILEVFVSLKLEMEPLAQQKPMEIEG